MAQGGAIEAPIAASHAFALVPIDQAASVGAGPPEDGVRAGDGAAPLSLNQAHRGTVCFLRLHPLRRADPIPLPPLAALERLELSTGSAHRGRR